MVNPKWDSMLAKPHELGKEHIDYLQSYIEEFPSFYLAHQLILKAYHNIGDPRFQRQLQITSLLSPNREELYFFINGRTEHKGIEADAAIEELSQDNTKVIEIVNESLHIEEEKDESETAQTKKETVFHSSAYRLEDIPQKIEEKKEDDREHAEEKNIPLETGPAPTDFYSWLEAKNSGRAAGNKSSEKEHKESTENLLDAFIQNNPSISPLDKDDIQPKKNYQIQQNIEDFSTETLARIFTKQKNYRKAIEVYEQLSLKIPEKKAYFATQILLLQDLLNEKK